MYIFCGTIDSLIFTDIPGPSSLGALNGCERVSIPHPLGFNWHPLEGAGMYIYIHIHIYIL